MFFVRPHGSYPNPKDCLPLPSSWPDFVASFLELRPHAPLHTPWNTNISSVIHHTVDSILSEDGVGFDDLSRRGVLGSLCRQVLEMQQWRTLPGKWAVYLYPTKFFDFHFPDAMESSAFEILLANILLGRRTSFLGIENTAGLLDCKTSPLKMLAARKSIIFGTLLEVCIKSGQIGLVNTLLDDADLDIQDESLNALEMAVQSDNFEVLSLLLSRYDFTRQSHEKGEFSRIEKLMTQAVDNERTDAALYIFRECELSHNPMAKKWLGYAAMHNNFPLVEGMLKYFDIDPSFSAMARDYDWIPAVAILYGHQDMVRLLLSHGLKCNTTQMMMAAMCGGRVSMVLFLLNDCGLRFDLDSNLWRCLLVQAIDHATRHHNALVEALFTHPDLFKKHNVTMDMLFPTAESYAEVLTHACGHGNMFLIRKLAEAGADLNDLQSYKDTPPVLVALLAGEKAVAKVLVELGARPIDPMKTKFRDGFERGWYPRFWDRRLIDLEYWRSLERSMCTRRVSKYV